MNVPTIPTTAAGTMPLAQIPLGRSTVLVMLDLLEMDTSARVKSYTSHLMPHSLYDVCITADHCVNIVYHEFLYTLLGSFQTSAEMLKIPSTVATKTLSAKNSDGSSKCICKPGFSGDGHNCTGNKFSSGHISH